MTEIVKRLRFGAVIGTDQLVSGLHRDAADELERLRAVILDIARIVENPDDRALQRVRDVTDKHSSVSATHSEE